MNEPLVLASASPRRAALLSSAGVRFVVRPAHIDETALPDEAPEPYVSRVAREKALAVPGAVVLAADSTVTLDGAILGKPLDDADAARILRLLAGRSHAVLTAVALRLEGPEGARLVELIQTTTVRFRPLTDAEIAAYVATGEPRDKAGAYGIQGQGGALVDQVWGSYTNVIGLPLAETLALLGREGLLPDTPTR